MSHADKIEQVVQAIAERRAELFALLKEAIAFPTVSPPARNTDAAQTWLARQLAECGFAIDRWTVYPGDDNVVGRLKGTASDAYCSLIINGHIDVAEVGNDAGWRYPPFSLTEGPDGRWYGRGPPT